MSLIHLIEGILIGFLMAVPIGAIGILCIRRTLATGRQQGYITGLAGASADLVFSAIAAFGIKFIADFITNYQHEIRLLGGVLLLLMGAVMFRPHRPLALRKEYAWEGTGIYFSTLVLALTNPLVMFGYGAVMSAIGVARLFHDYTSLSSLVAGVFFGSLLWFVGLANVIHRFRGFVAEEKLQMVNRVAGVLLILIGLVAVWGGVNGLR